MVERLMSITQMCAREVAQRATEHVRRPMTKPLLQLDITKSECANPDTCHARSQLVWSTRFDFQ